LKESEIVAQKDKISAVRHSVADRGIAAQSPAMHQLLKNLRQRWRQHPHLPIDAWGITIDNYYPVRDNEKTTDLPSPNSSKSLENS